MKAIVAGVGLLLGACVSVPAPQTGLIGTWRLVAYEDQADGGPISYPYGANPKGLLIYDDTGHMAIQIMKVPHPKVASGSDEDITPEEKIALFDAYTAYFGTYRIDAARGVVIVHAEADTADVFIGEVEERPFTLNGDRLALTPEWTENGVHWKGLRVFERVR